MAKPLTRRQFLKLIVGAAATATLAPTLHARAHYPVASDPNKWVLMGRTIYSVTFYEEAARTSKKLETRARDQAVEILEEVRAPFSAHNDLWYRTPLGFVHSAWVLPVRVYAPQPFLRDLGAWGCWGEVAQIFTEAYAKPDINAGHAYRFYGGTVYHVVEAFEDAAGTGWYKIADDFPPKTERYQWVLARDVRRIPRNEMAPIRPFVSHKRIEIDLSKQTLTCFEDETSVFVTQIASGMGGAMETPVGNHAVLLKQPSRHMCNVPYPGGPAPLGEIFDLPGVPWNTFFDLSGTAIHGAYWHNDFGMRRSHGCVNVPCEAARFVYRWGHPVGGYEDTFVQSDPRVGTPIKIF